MSTFAHGYAILIGVDENAVAEFALPDVSKDIAALYAVLTHPERCAYPAEQVKRITGSAATRDGILEGLSWLHEVLQQDQSGNATAVIFYSGHGLRTASGDNATFYLVPYNVRAIGLTASALNAAEFAAAINELHPKRLLVALDCCHAAGMGVKEAAPLARGYAATALPAHLLGDGQGVTPSNSGAKGLDTLQTGAGRAILTSSQGEQPSYIRKDRAMSIFTYHLIEALTGHAQTADGAGEVLVSDIMSHVYRRVPTSAQRDWQAAQTPDYQISGNFPVALLLGGKGLSKGQPAPDPLVDPAATPAGPSATNSGSGAIAQGPGAVATGGNVSGSTIITGNSNQVEQVNTGGAAYIRGNVTVGSGDFVARDKITYGDEVRGDKIKGDKITIGNMTGNTGVAIGSHARNNTTVSTGTTSVALEQLFAPLLAFAQVAPPAERANVLAAVQTIQSEATRGAQADDRRLARAIEALVALLPAAAGILTFILQQPPTTTAVGPATTYVLEKLRE